MKNALSKKIADLSLKSAKKAASKSSDWVFHQAKEPKDILKRITK